MYYRFVREIGGIFFIRNWEKTKGFLIQFETQSLYWAVSVAGVIFDVHIFDTCTPVFSPADL